MNKSVVQTFAVAALLCAASAPAQAARVVDTGSPNGDIIGAYAFDSVDSFAGQITLAGASQIASIATHVLGGTAGESFTVLLYDDSAAHLPGNALYSATATFGADGWNGVAGLAGWNVSAGTYWVGLDVGAADTLGGGSATGALLDRGAPSPLVRTAFNAGSGYQATTSALSIGLRVDTVTAVPEPSAMWMLLLGGLIVTGSLARRSRG